MFRRIHRDKSWKRWRITLFSNHILRREEVLTSARDRGDCGDVGTTARDEERQSPSRALWVHRRRVCECCSAGASSRSTTYAAESPRSPIAGFVGLAAENEYVGAASIWFLRPRLFRPLSITRPRRAAVGDLRQPRGERCCKISTIRQGSKADSRQTAQGIPGDDLRPRAASSPRDRQSGPASRVSTMCASGRRCSFLRLGCPRRREAVHVLTVQDQTQPAVVAEAQADLTAELNWATERLH